MWELTVPWEKQMKEAQEKKIEIWRFTGAMSK